MTASLLIVIDLGATKIAAALANSGVETLAAFFTPTMPGRSTEAVIDDISGLVLKSAANHSSALGAASMVWYGLGLSTQREEVSQRKV